jgi:hypothetical protein
VVHIFWTLSFFWSEIIFSKTHRSDACYLCSKARSYRKCLQNESTGVSHLSRLLSCLCSRLVSSSFTASATGFSSRLRDGMHQHTQSD